MFKTSFDMLLKQIKTYNYFSLNLDLRPQIIQLHIMRDFSLMEKFSVPKSTKTTKSNLYIIYYKFFGWKHFKSEVDVGKYIFHKFSDAWGFIHLIPPSLKKLSRIVIFLMSQTPFLWETILNYLKLTILSLGSVL